MYRFELICEYRCNDLYGRKTGRNIWPNDASCRAFRRTTLQGKIWVLTMLSGTAAVKRVDGGRGRERQFPGVMNYIQQRAERRGQDGGLWFATPSIPLQTNNFER